MGSDLYFLDRQLGDRRRPIMERFVSAFRKRFKKSKILREEPFKSMLAELDELEIK